MLKKQRLFFFLFLLVALTAGAFLWFKKPSSQNSIFRPALPESREAVLQIAILADVHSDWGRLQQAVEKINADSGIDLVFVLGDLTKLGSLQDLRKFKSLISELKVSWYVVPGNHDVWSSLQADRNPDYNFNQVFGSQPACFTSQGFNLVLLDNSNEKNPLSQNHRQEIERCLDQKEPVLFFAHEPLYHPANDRLMGQYLTDLVKQRETLLKELCQKQAKLVMAAHLHSFAEYKYKCSDDYLLPMVIAPALTGERNFQSPRFLRVDIFDDGSFKEEQALLD